MEWLCYNWLTLLSIAISVSVPFALYTLKPKLKIEIDKGIENQSINIRVINKRCSSGAMNLNMEVCTVRSIDKTKHLKIEKEDFLILPSKDNRVFNAECLPKIEEKLKQTGTILRVRVYATHSLTGFGKAFEQKFMYDTKSNRFHI